MQLFPTPYYIDYPSWHTQGSCAKSCLCNIPILIYFKQGLKLNKFLNLEKDEQRTHKEDTLKVKRITWK
jgi:hypothetical protein